MKKLILTLVLILPLLVNAQASSYFHGGAKEFTELKKRALLVELLEEDPKILKKLEKPKNADKLVGYKNMIKYYNQEIQLYAKKYWTLNSSIEFKTATEIEALKEAKQKYAILRNLRLNDIDIDFGAKSNLYLNALVFTRIESDNKKADSQVYTPANSKYTGKYLYEADYRFCLEVLQANIEYIISKKKNVNSEKYVELIAGENCPKVKEKTLLVKESMLYGKTKAEECIKAYGGKIQFVSDDEFNRAFVEKDADKVCLFSIPWEIGKGSMGPVNQSFIMSYKTVLDAQTGKILYVFLPTGFSAFGQNITPFIIPKDLENIKNCK
ncbi:hypothetical protein [Flavobacterium sp.]|uniref:hypothetical protein n=1 Tax=Flavobacterium sp. TaxID=239 RepID=UPI002620078B|nr:hypothetical protein [Flavobacterium sp.]